MNQSLKWIVSTIYPNKAFKRRERMETLNLPKKQEVLSYYFIIRLKINSLKALAAVLQNHA